MPRVFAASVAVPAAPAAAAGTGWWARSGYTVTNSGFNPNETSVTVSTVPNLKLKYTAGPARIDQRAPLVADGLVYTPDERGITATDEVSGEQKWRFEPDPARFRAPWRLVHLDGRIVAAANDNGVMPGMDSTQVFVLDAPTGTLVRDFDDFGVTTQFLVDRGVVVVSGESRYTGGHARLPPRRRAAVVAARQVHGPAGLGERARPPLRHRTGRGTAGQHHRRHRHRHDPPYQRGLARVRPLAADETDGAHLTVYGL